MKKKAGSCLLLVAPIWRWHRGVHLRSVPAEAQGEAQGRGMEGKAKSNPPAQPVFIKTAFRFGFCSFLMCRLLYIKGRFLPQQNIMV